MVSGDWKKNNPVKPTIKSPAVKIQAMQTIPLLNIFYQKAKMKYLFLFYFFYKLCF